DGGLGEPSRVRDAHQRVPDAQGGEQDALAVGPGHELHRLCPEGRLAELDEAPGSVNDNLRRKRSKSLWNWLLAGGHVSSLVEQRAPCPRAMMTPGGRRGSTSQFSICYLFRL